MAYNRLCPQTVLDTGLSICVASLSDYTAGARRREERRQAVDELFGKPRPAARNR